MRKTIILITILILGLAHGVQGGGSTQIVSPTFSGAELSLPKSINFQGYLYRDGNPMDTTMNMWFGIYDAPSVGNLLFQQTINNVTVTKGWFTVSLDNIPNSIFPVAGPTRYLEVKAPATGPSLSQRISLVSVGYSYHSITADSAEYAKVAPLSRPITPPIYSNEIRDTTITTAKIKDGAITSVKILDATIKGVDIAMPCSLQGSVSVPTAILNIRNNGSGRGIVIDKVGGHGIYIDSTPGGNGLYVNKTSGNGVYIDSSSGSGIYVNKTLSNGIQVNDATRHGFRVNQADSCGLYVNRAIRNGVHIDSVNNTGVYVKRADHYGFRIDRAGIDGVSIGSADFGIYIDSVDIFGIMIDHSEDAALYVFGKNAGGKLWTESPSGVALIAYAYMGTSTDTAIQAYGRGYATGGWFTGGLLGNKEAPCLISPELGIIAAGTGKLSNGKAEISFDPVLVENIRTDIPVRITVTPRGKPAGFIYITDSKATGFKVELMPIPGLENNSMDVTFDWIAFATLKEFETSPDAKAEWEKAMKEREERRNRHSDMR